MSRLYSLKEIREILDKQGAPIPDGTLRNYRDSFQSFLPSEGTGMNKRYHGDSIEVFKFIRSLKKERRLDTYQIRSELSKFKAGLPGIDNDSDSAPSSLQTADGVHQKLDSIINRFELLEQSQNNLETRSKLLIDHITRILSILQQKIVQDQKSSALTKDIFETKLGELKEELRKIEDLILMEKQR